MARYAKYIHRKFFRKDVKNNDEAKTADETMEKDEIKILDATHPFTFQMEDNSKNATLTDSIHGDICKYANNREDGFILGKGGALSLDQPP